MTKKERNFTGNLSSLLYNFSATQNNNHAITEEQTHYYKGIILACVSLTMAFYNCDFEFAMHRIYEYCPNDSHYIIYIALPKSWREIWAKVAGM